MSGASAPVFTGRLVRRGDPDYDDARVGRVFNARRPDRHPIAVLLAETEADVVAGVRLARAEGWSVAVRAGGHSWAAWSVRDGSLLIDLGHFAAVDYDPATGVAAAGPAARGGLDLDPVLAAHGRAFPGGHCASVGIGGFLLQGGQGWNSRSQGWACESVVGIDVVTADGDLVHADAEHHADLLWAARGAGPGFPGVITRFHLRTYPRPAVMAHDTWTFRLDDAGALLGWLHDILPGLDTRVEPVVAATRLPDVPLDTGVARPDGTVLLLHTTVLAESRAEIDAMLAPFDDCPLADRRLGHVRAETDIAQENEAQTEQNPEGHRYVVDCTWTNASAAELAEPLSALWRDLPTMHSFSIWYGWAPSRPLPDMAFSVEANVYLATYVIYTDPADDERHSAFVHGRTDQLAALGGAGVYLGDTDFVRRTDRFLSDENYARLQEINRRRDPGGLFCSYLVGDVTRLNSR
ncbi:FAD-binding oxidoreductase [uncultured Jatrophihabitans sp.]|uniref:FAD-binding oxidoreductase n=1 Tax=uncultured Jatrophihabitans sp. TaxID=1610747 RepID=UPI0035CB0841